MWAHPRSRTRGRAPPFPPRPAPPRLHPRTAPTSNLHLAGSPIPRRLVACAPPNRAATHWLRCPWKERKCPPPPAHLLGLVFASAVIALGISWGKLLPQSATMPRTCRPGEDSGEDSGEDFVRGSVVGSVRGFAGDSMRSARYLPPAAPPPAMMASWAHRGEGLRGPRNRHTRHRCRSVPLPPAPLPHLPPPPSAAASDSGPQEEGLSAAVAAAVAGEARTGGGGTAVVSR